MIPLLIAMTDFSESSVKNELTLLLRTDAIIRMCYPFGEIQGPHSWYDVSYKPLFKAFPDLERRNMIIVAGDTPEGNHWVGCMGNYIGTFMFPFLDIPPTGHLAHMRFHEFFRFEETKVVEVQAIWDLPELMMLSNSWPMAPQLGTYICTPSPITGDGLTAEGDGSKNMSHVKSMLTDMCLHPADPHPKVMNLEKYWHPRFNWYGPAGIGTSRGISGFRNWHQIPFLRAMPDRALDEKAELFSHWIAQGSYVSETGWPNMRLNLKDNGWMGIAPVRKEIFLRSLDFWKLDDNELIRENWVLVDLLDMYSQIGINVFDRLKEFNKSRYSSSGDHL